jgi:ferredoxin
MSNHRSDAWISTEQLQENFAEVNSPLSTTHAVKESNRCLFCYDAPCIQACPTGIDIPSFIKKIASGNLKGSAVTIMDANPVGASCARVCPTEELCEGACVLNGESEPIMIGDLQRYATDWAIRNEQVLFEAGPSTSKHVAIVGSGPAGLAAARELARFGHQVTIFEADDEPGGLNRYGIVSFRLPVDIVQWEINQIVNMGVTIRTNTAVGKTFPRKSSGSSLIPSLSLSVWEAFRSFIWKERTLSAYMTLLILCVPPKTARFPIILPASGWPLSAPATRPLTQPPARPASVLNTSVSFTDGRKMK